MMDVDAARQLDAWWRHFVATGRAHPDLEPVQARLIRTVHRGALAGRTVYVKAMTFPRGKDRLRYSVRPMPTAHEAELLRAAAAAGVRCPEVLAERSQRRCGLPRRAMLVLEGLPAEPCRLPEDLADCARTVRRLLAAGIVHRDLHLGNFLRLPDGTIAMLDFQSARRTPGPADGRVERVAAAAWLLFAASAQAERAAAEVQRGGLLVDAGEVAAALAEAARMRQEWAARRRVRCLQTSTQFERRWSPLGWCVRRRVPPAPTAWRRGGCELREAWIGEHLLVEQGGATPRFAGLRREWWRGLRAYALAGPTTTAAFDAAVAVARAAAGAATPFGPAT